MAKNNNLKDYLKDLYAGISTVKPSASRDPQQFRSEIESLASPEDATATAADIRLGETAYTSDGKVTGTMEDYDGSVTGASVEYTTLQSNLPTFLGWEIYENALESDIITINGNEIIISMSESLGYTGGRDIQLRAHMEHSKASAGTGFKVTAYSTKGCEIWYGLYAYHREGSLDGGSFDVYANGSNYIGGTGYELDDPNADAERLYASFNIYPESMSSELSGTVRLVWEAVR